MPTGFKEKTFLSEDDIKDRKSGRYGYDDDIGKRYLICACFSELLREQFGEDVYDCYDAHDLLVAKRIVPKNPTKAIAWDHESCCNYYEFSNIRSARGFVSKFNRVYNKLVRESPS